MALVYDGSGIVTGPTLSGCTVASDMGSIEVLFNTTLLAGDSILVQAWDANASNFGTDQVGRKSKRNAVDAATSLDPLPQHID